MNNLRELFKKINIKGIICYAEPMARHTTFQIGGPADVFAQPARPEDLVTLHRVCSREQLPVFLLGGGANILVADAGIRGLVISLASLNRFNREGTQLQAEAGMAISVLSQWAAEEGLCGLEFIYGMPGSVGGSLFMNARCYDVAVGDILESATVIDQDSNLRQLPLNPALFGYKQSPFRQSGHWIVSARFRMSPGKPAEIRQTMDAKRQDREEKGHFLYPCAGSVFKNNRTFGHPSGAIIDSLGLRGQRCGGACISQKHANIIVNTGGASAGDVLQLMRLIRNRVQEAYGFILEPELILAGAWEESL